MARKKDSHRDIVESVLADVRGQLTGTSTGLAQRLASAGADRARRLETSSARMAEALGDDHPRVVRMRRRATLVKNVTDRVDDGTRRVVDADKLRPHEWLVHGRVTREDDTPLEGMRVRVFDKDRAEADLLGDEITDQSGEFRAIYHVRDFLDEEEKLPDLYVMVSDRTGKVVVVSEQPIQPTESRAVYLQIVITAERLEKGVPRTRCEAMTAKGTRCRNLAVAGSPLCTTHFKSE